MTQTSDPSSTLPPISLEEPSSNSLKTDDFELACFLAVKGVKIIAIQRHPESTKDNRRAIVVFEDGGETRRLLGIHEAGDRSDPELIVNIIDYEEAKRRVRKTIDFNLGKYNHRYEKSPLL